MSRSPASPKSASADPTDPSGLSELHLRLGWWSLFVFVTLGLVLETLHGFKVGYYLDVSNSTRRLMWRLAHTHGTLLSLLNVVFALALPAMPRWEPSTRLFVSRCLRGAVALMPLGFFLGGVSIHGGDPGLGAAVLVPPGAFLLVVGLLVAARAMGRSAG